jgi:hypothetical protein
MHLFEFMDLPWMPSSLRATMRDILECGNSRPFRPYYAWVTDEIVQLAKKRGAKTVVELGAGTAPFTRHLLRHPDATSLSFVVCDSNPDADAYRQLEDESQGRVRPIYEPVDISQTCVWGKDSLLVLSGMLHHIPSADRVAVLSKLRSCSKSVLVIEPLRCNLWSILFVPLSFVPAIVTPLRYLRRGGRLRRFAWCWILPVAPIVFCWDGVISCIRMWSSRQWRANLAVSDNASAQITHSLLSQMVIF